MRELASNQEIKDGWLMRWLQLTERVRRRMASLPPEWDEGLKHMMTAENLKDIAQLACPPYGNMLEPALAGRHAGKAIVLLGNGPSAAEYKPKKGDIVIACNNALALAPEAQYWLVQEGGAHTFPWFWQHKDYKGQVVWDRFIAHAAERLLAEYGEPFLARVIWSIRELVLPGWRIREYCYNESKKQGGLAEDRVQAAWHTVFGSGPPNPYDRMVPVGTVLMQGIHLAGIMGAARVDIWGGEFYFPGGRQHADEYAPYTQNDSEVGIINFEIVNGEPQPVEHGTYQTTRQFYYSAAAIRDMLALIGDEMEVADHSGGLLNPASMGKSPPLKHRAEPGQPAAESVPEI